MRKKKWLLPKAGRYAKGMYVPEIKLRTIREETITIPDFGRVVHLQFRRFAGCPVCNLHLKNFARQYGEIQDAGIHEIIIFHSGKEELLKYTKGFPFSLIADPQKKLYRQFGVETSLRSLLAPKAVIAIFRGVVNSFKEYLQHKRPLPSFSPEGGSLGLPADFLIASDGKIIDSYYGRHADDHWSVKEVLQKVKHSKSYTEYINHF